jgi:streptogramin lyase
MNLSGRGGTDEAGTARLPGQMAICLALVKARHQTARNSLLVGRLDLVLVCLLLILSLVATAGAARAAQITEFPLGPNDFSPEAITAGPDGNMWFTNTEGLGQNSTREIDRITPEGQITTFPLPSSSGNILRSITAGPDGNLWFTEGSGRIGRITPAGELGELRIPASSYSVAAGPDGNLWFGETASGAEPWQKIARMTPDGQITRFRLPPETSGSAIASGPEGIWFLGANQIGRITTEGEIKTFPLPSGLSTPVGRPTAGPDGALWFLERTATTERTDLVSIARITPDGRVTEFPIPTPALPGYYGSLAAGADGRIWFTNGAGIIWRATPSGRITKLNLSESPYAAPVGVAAGPGGTIWFIALGEGPCMGGGSSCHEQPPGAAGVVGRIVPDALTPGIVSRRVWIRGRYSRIELACTEGNAWEACRGTVRLRMKIPKASGYGQRLVELGKRTFALPPDSRRTISLRIKGGIRAGLLPNHKYRARVMATLRSGSKVERRVLLSRAGG